MVTSHGFDPSVYRRGLTGQNRRDFDALGRNTGGDYSGWAKNAGFGDNVANAFNKRYGMPQINTPGFNFVDSGHGKDRMPLGPGFQTSGHDNPNDPMARRLNRQFGVTSHGPGSGAPPTAGPGSGMPMTMNNMGGQGIAPGGMRPPMGPVQREWNMGGGGMNNMVQGPSFMQQPQQMQSPMQQNPMNPDMNNMLGLFGMMSMMNNRGGQPSAPAGPQRNRMAGGVVDPNFSRMMQFKNAGGMGSPIAQRPGSNAQYGPGAFGVSPSIYYSHFDQQGMPLQQQKQPDLWSVFSQLLGNRGQQGY